MMNKLNDVATDALFSISKSIALFLLAILLVITGACTTVKPKIKATQPTTKAPKIALVLGAGGAKGYAHVGVINVLEQHGIKPDLIVGSSVGSFVGSLYASGMSAAQLNKLALTTDPMRLTDFTLAHQGIIEGKKLKDFVNMHVAQKPIQALPIRFAAVATEKHSSKTALLTQGNTGLAVQASCSVPNLFIAPRIPEKNGTKYVDGGVSQMLPINMAKQMGAQVIIAVDVMPSKPEQKDRQMGAANANINSLKRLKSLPALNTLVKQDIDIWQLLQDNYDKLPVHDKAQNKDSSEQTLATAPFLFIAHGNAIIIQPKVTHVSSIDIHQRQHTIQAGENAARASLPAIAQALAQATTAASP